MQNDSLKRKLELKRKSKEKYMHVIMVILSLLLSSVAIAATECDFLLTRADGESIAVERIESLYGNQVKILDASSYVEETQAISTPELKVVKIPEVFSRDVTFMGVGLPNVYTAFPVKIEDTEGNQSTRIEKFDAKSLKRADSKMIPTRGKIQSGVMMVFPNLSKEASVALYQAALKHEGTRRWTCVNANCRVLEDAGFHLSGESKLSEFYFPIPFLKALITQQLDFRGEPVEIKLVRTTPLYLENFGWKNNWAVGTTPVRHLERAAQKKDANKALVFVAKLESRLKSAYAVVVGRANQNYVDYANYANADARLRDIRLSSDALSQSDLELFVSEPSNFGVLLRILWGPHSLFEMVQHRVDINDYLPNKKREFPQENPDLLTRIKQNFLFSKPVIKLIRSQMTARYQNFDGVSDKNLFDMLRVHTKDEDNKFNIVITGKRVIVQKLSIMSKAVDWVLSKHVLVSNYSDDVRFAGEIWKNELGQVVINRNSGTYQPSKEELEAAAEYLRQVFPGVDVIIDDTM